MIELINKLNEPTIDNGIRNMKFSKMMHLTKNGKFYFSITEEYLKNKEKLFSIWIRFYRTYLWIRRKKKSR